MIARGMRLAIFCCAHRFARALEIISARSVAKRLQTKTDLAQCAEVAGLAVELQAWAGQLGGGPCGGLG